MDKQILALLGAGLIGLMHPGAAQATLLDFTFSFDEVTGEIFDLKEGATSAARNVIVDHIPGPGAPQAVFTNITSNTFIVYSMGDVI